MVLVAVSPFLIFSAPVYSQASWPTSWIEIDWDKNENGPKDDWRDVEYAYYQYDSSYFYLKLKCYDTPGKKWAVAPDGDGRYKWFIDFEGNLTFSGENIFDAEYLLFVEDTDEDASGEMYLLYETNGDNNFGEYEPWPPANYSNYEVTDPNVGGWRIFGTYQMEMYISWSSIGDPSSFWITWATDQENSNLDQGPTTDHADEEQPIPISRAQYTLTVNIVGSGSVTKNPDQATYTNGTVVTLTAVPDAGWSFSNWSGDLTGSTNPDTITMDSNKTVTATFTQDQYTLTITTTTGGTTSPPPGDHVYSPGTNVSVTATPDACYQFDHWELDGVDVGSANPYTVTMDANHTLHAVFTQINYTLTITTTTGGTTSPSPGAHDYPCCTNVSVTAIPDACYVFDHWELDGFPAGSANPITVHMDSDHTLHAVFATINYTLTITTTSGGTTSPSPGPHVYSCCTNVSVTAVPDTCYQFDHWELDGVDVGSANPYTVHMDSDHTLHAVFAITNYTLTITSTAGGTTNPSPGSYKYSCSSSVPVTATPDHCYQFDHWELDGVDVGSANPYTVTMDGDHTLHAVFTQITYTLTITTTTGGTTSPSPSAHDYPCCSNVSVTAIPDSGFAFDHWELDGVDVGSANPYTVHMDSDHTLHAVFTGVTYTLTITTTAGGTTSPSPGAHVYPYCTNVSVTATPDPCYQFDHWELDSVDVGSANPYAVHMDMNHTLKAVFVRKTFWLTIQVEGIGTTDPSPGVYKHNCCEYVSVAAIETDPCWRFDHWELDGSWNYSNPISVHVNDNYTLKAVFVRKTFWLTIQVTGTGTTSPSPGAYQYNCSEDASVTAIETNPCWKFDHWMLDGTPAGSSNPITVHMDANHTLHAVFTQINYTLTVNIVGSGSVTKNPDLANYPCGTQVNLTANPDPCWTFSGWSGDASGTATQITITMDSDKTVTATFTQEEYTLAINIVGSGSVTKSPDMATYPCGTVVTLTAVPDAGWKFSHWSGDASGTTSPTTVTMDGHKTVTATFIEEMPPTPVGGYAAPIDIAIGKEVSHLLASQIGLAFALLAAMAVTILLTRRRGKRLKQKR